MLHSSDWKTSTLPYVQPRGPPPRDRLAERQVRANAPQFERARQAVTQFHDRAPKTREAFAVEQTVLRRAAMAADLRGTVTTAAKSLVSGMAEGTIPPAVHRRVADCTPLGAQGFEFINTMADTSPSHLPSTLERRLHSEQQQQQQHRAVATPAPRFDLSMTTHHVDDVPDGSVCVPRAATRQQPRRSATPFDSGPSNEGWKHATGQRDLLLRRIGDTLKRMPSDQPARRSPPPDAPYEVISPEERLRTATSYSAHRRHPWLDKVGRTRRDSASVNDSSATPGALTTPSEPPELWERVPTAVGAPGFDDTDELIDGCSTAIVVVDSPGARGTSPTGRGQRRLDAMQRSQLELARNQARYACVTQRTSELAQPKRVLQPPHEKAYVMHRREQQQEAKRREALRRDCNRVHLPVASVFDGP